MIILVFKYLENYLIKKKNIFINLDPRGLKRIIINR